MKCIHPGAMAAVYGIYKFVVYIFKISLVCMSDSSRQCWHTHTHGTLYIKPGHYGICEFAKFWSSFQLKFIIWNGMFLSHPFSLPFAYTQFGGKKDAYLCLNEYDNIPHARPNKRSPFAIFALILLFCTNPKNISKRKLN